VFVQFQSSERIINRQTKRTSEQEAFPLTSPFRLYPPPQLSQQMEVRDTTAATAASATAPGNMTIDLNVRADDEFADEVEDGMEEEEEKEGEGGGGGGRQRRQQHHHRQRQHQQPSPSVKLVHSALHLCLEAPRPDR